MASQISRLGGGPETSRVTQILFDWSFLYEVNLYALNIAKSLKYCPIYISKTVYP